MRKSWSEALGRLGIDRLWRKKSRTTVRERRFSVEPLEVRQLLSLTATLDSKRVPDNLQNAAVLAAPPVDCMYLQKLPAKDEILPTVSIGANDGSASESGPDAGQFTVYRTGETSSSLTVYYSIGGSATNGSDYLTISTCVTIPADSATATIDIAPYADGTYEGSEDVCLALLSSRRLIVLRHRDY
jgi:hypothetical protein